MIGTIYDDHCEQDIKDAQALGVDAFALNLSDDTDSWATTTVASLFKWAAVYDFKLFFSFDMSGFSNPDQFTNFLLSYVTNSAYYTYNGLPLVSTFNGGASSFIFGQDSVNDGWKVELQNVMASASHPVYFVPAFQDVSASSDFFTSEYPTLGDIIVPTTDDVTYQTAAKASGKTFMMGVSPLQFKHIDSSQNWYRRGEQNLEYRFGQVLALQPDFVELQTWNDAGESHYMGNSWPEPIDGTVEGTYTADYDHTGYQEICQVSSKPIRQARHQRIPCILPTGRLPKASWHHTLLVNGDCSTDSLGKPSGINTAEDKVTVVVLVEEGHSTYNLKVVSGNMDLGSQTLVPGYNQYSVSGLTAGNVTVTVTDSASISEVLSGTGPIPISFLSTNYIQVTNSSALCNYNFQVVALA